MNADRMEKSEETKTRIYDAAIDLFCEIGYKQTKLTNIAEEAGVSTRTLYKYYPTKESILRRFGQENMLALKAYASSLPSGMSLKEKTLSVMIKDFENMFCLFDISFITHSAREGEDNEVFRHFEMKNIFSAQSIYAYLCRNEQAKRGMKNGDGAPAAELCASVIVAIYRECNDVFRYDHKPPYDCAALRAFFEQHLDIVWDSLYKALFRDMT